MTESMQAILVRAAGDAGQLYLGETPRPTPGSGELLVRVHATALNRADNIAAPFVITLITADAD